MISQETYPKRLIEVDLPIKRISAHARRETSIRHGRISALHIWWARRPLAACRAVLCAALWPDPADPRCPKSFKGEARKQMLVWANNHAAMAGAESFSRLVAIQKAPATLDDDVELRNTLLDFIADFGNWKNSTAREYLTTSRSLTQAAHEALGGTPGTRPLVLDPFAGGGSIPLESLRVGADAFASDLNPIAVLLNKVILEYVPRFGDRLAAEVEKWGQWIVQEAKKELAPFYPVDADGATPIAYLWARTIACEGPGCGAAVPLINQLWIGKRRRVAAKLMPKGRHVEIRVTHGNKTGSVGKGTVENASVTCPVCGFTMSADRYRRRAADHELGERMYCTVLARGDGSREYREPSADEEKAFRAAAARLARVTRSTPTAAGPRVPKEKLSKAEPRRLNVLQYGFEDWGSLFNQRQLLAILTIAQVQARAFGELRKAQAVEGLAEATSTVLGLCLSNILQYNCSMSTWLSDGMISVFIQSSSIPMRADYAEANPLMNRLVGGLDYQIRRSVEALRQAYKGVSHHGVAELGSATAQLLPDESADACVTDPPYYFAIPYAELSDFFYVWIKQFLAEVHPDLLGAPTTPKKDEAIQNLAHSKGVGQKDRAHFEKSMYESLSVARRVVKPGGIAVVVFAHASTEGWEALLSALLKAGWIITGSWPIDTEREGRMLASRQRTLASSVHLVCRPREDPDGAVRSREVGEWRDVLRELPRRIHEWMPRLAAEGVAGADAIFACLGPALEVFSRYSRVEKSSGDPVSLTEYLAHVWGAVSKEALAMIFAGADATGFEEDARLTAMWLWTLSTGSSNGNGANGPQGREPGDDEEDETGAAKSKVSGFVLEYDAARKIAQGLGAHLEALSTLVEVKGSNARLLPVVERTKSLFQKEDPGPSSSRVKAKKKSRQLSMEFVAELEDAEESEGWGATGAPQSGETVLDRVHQSMILFGAGRSEALKRFLVDESVGRDDRFWRLAQALSALYPGSTDEKRWVDGVLARKKALGF